MDLGCGCGGNSIFLAKHNFQVVALDRRKEAINCLKGRIKNLKIRRKISSGVVDLSISSWPKKKYVLIIALNTFHFLPPKRAVLLINRIKNSLADDGVIFLRLFSNRNAHRGKGYHPTPTALKNKFSNFQIIQFSHYKVKDNHPPIGLHQHWVLDLIAKKSD